MFKGKKSKENIKTYKKALRQDLASDSKAPARLRCQSHWLSHLTAVGMRGAHADLVRPPTCHQKLPLLSPFTPAKHHSRTRYLKASVYGLPLLATASNTALRPTAGGTSCQMLMPLCPGSAGGWGRVGSARSGSHGPDQADAGMGCLRQANGQRQCRCSAHPQRPRFSKSATGLIRLGAQTSTGPEGKYAPRRL